MALVDALAARASCCWLRTVPPELTAEYARVHDSRVLQCLCDVLQIRNGLPGQTLETASLPLTLGGGVGCSARVRDAAFWGSWADCLEMVKARPASCAGHDDRLSHPEIRCLSSVTGAVNRLLEAGVHVPEWKEIADGLRLEDLRVSEWEPCEGRGWQRHASATVRSQQGRSGVASPLLGRAKSGSLASVPFTALPIHRISRMDSEPFRVLLLRRLRMPLSLSMFVPAGVAVSLTSLATTAQRAAEWWSRARGRSLQKVRSLKFQGRRRASVHKRHAAGLGRSDGRRLEWWPMGCVARRVPACFGCHRRLRASRRWNTTGGRRTWRMELRWRRQEEAKRPRTLSCVGEMAEHDLRSSLERSEASGWKKQRTSSGVRLARSPSLLRGCCRGA